jgi:MFS family permease
MEPDSALIGDPAAESARMTRWAYATFAALFLMNLLDYMDRNVLYAVLPQVQRDLKIGDEKAGLLATYFLVAYSVFGILTGYLGDRVRRTYLLAAGVGIWGLATFASGMAQTYGQMALARSILGIGEATYGVIAPTLLLDLFRRGQRARVLSGFYLAMPIGSALGMVLGGAIAEHDRWQTAFFLVGAPAIVAAIGALFLPEPVRGASEEVDAARLRSHERVGATWEDYRDLLVNSSYTYAVFGLTAYTFAIGGLLVWIPTFLIGTRGMNQTWATSTLGVVTLFAAIIGMSLGGWLADRLSRKDRRALFIVPGVAMLLAVPFLLVALFSRSPTWIFAGIFLAETLMFVNTGPCSAIIGNVVAPNMRSAAFAVAIATQHFLGDIWSPWLIGKVSDLCGKADTMVTPLGRALASIGAVPTMSADHPLPRNLLAGLLVVVPAVTISGLVMLAGARHLPREMALMLARLRAAPAPPAGSPPATATADPGARL